MMKKAIQIPLKVESLEAALLRLSKNYVKRPRVEQELGIAKAGYFGEKSIDYYLKDFSSNHFHILHDLRLRISNDNFFQIDILINTPNYLLIIEVKNYIGTLYFEGNFKQLIREKNGVEEGMENPIPQVINQQRKLKKWLDINNLPSLPIIPLVVIANPTTIIKASSDYKEALEMVYLADNLPAKILSIQQTFNTRRKIIHDLDSFSNHLINCHEPKEVDILQQLKIPESAILTGVYCPNCLALPMSRKKGSWHCPKCLFVSKDAHILSLKHYYLLLGKTITNQKLRTFLHLPSPYTASRILRSMNLKYTGSTKFRQYELHF